MNRNRNASKNLRSLYGLKWNPFAPELPAEALYTTPAIDEFGWRVEQHLVREGGFALICGAPGCGKSVTLRLLAERLGHLPDVVVGALTRPQSNLADFYRELGALFAVPLRPHNRWAGAGALRERWQVHIDSTLMRPVLLVDEAQEMAPAVLNELRLLASTRFDSRIILSVVLAGDDRLTDKLRRDDLVPLGSRIRYRLALGQATREELESCLLHLMESAGNAGLMTKPLVDTLCEHALGNYRVLATMAAEILAAGARREADHLDEKLYFEVFGRQPAPRKRTRRGAP